MHPRGPLRPSPVTPDWASFAPGTEVRCPSPDTARPGGRCGRRIASIGVGAHVKVRDHGLREPAREAIDPIATLQPCPRCGHYLEIKAVDIRMTGAA